MSLNTTDENASVTIETRRDFHAPFLTNQTSSSSSPLPNRSGCCCCCSSRSSSSLRIELLHQLGLESKHPHDGNRVYLRIITLGIILSSALYFILLFAFQRWFDFAGAIALLATTFCMQFLIGCVGWLASRPVPVISAEPPVSPLPSVTPHHPIALTIMKWSSILPTSIVCFAFAVWLGCAMMNIIDTHTELTLGSRSQVASVLVLGINSLLSLALQCLTFLIASAWENQSVDDREEEDYDWRLTAHAYDDRIATGARIDGDEQ